GLVLVRQRPGTASGICFITIEDETGTTNLVVFKKFFDKYRKEIIQSRLLMVEGQLQREGEVVHVIVKRCFDVSRLLQRLTKSQKLHPTDSKEALSPTKNAVSGTPKPDWKKDEVIQAKIFPEG